jgi:hypothetical protein
MHEIQCDDIEIFVFTLDSIVKLTYNRCRHFAQEIRDYKAIKNLEENGISLLETRRDYLMSKIPRDSSLNPVHEVVYQRISLIPPLEIGYTLGRHYQNELLRICLEESFLFIFKQQADALQVI